MITPFYQKGPEMRSIHCFSVSVCMLGLLWSTGNVARATIGAVKVSSTTDAGSFRGRPYQRFDGRMEGTAPGGGYSVPVTLFLPANVSDANGFAVVDVLNTVAVGKDTVLGPDPLPLARHHIGDDVRIGESEGRIITLGLRSMVLRDRDGTEATVPYRRVGAAEVVRLNLARQDAPCEFEVAIPADLDLEACTRKLLEAAMLSPYAAPGRRPEVFAIADARGGMRLCVRAYVFDRAYEERYRGDVLSRAELVGARPKLEVLGHTT